MAEHPTEGRSRLQAGLAQGLDPPCSSRGSPVKRLRSASMSIGSAARRRGGASSRPAASVVKVGSASASGWVTLTMRNDAALGPSGVRMVWTVFGVLSNSSGSSSVAPHDVHGLPCSDGRGGQGHFQVSRRRASPPAPESCDRPASPADWRRSATRRPARCDGGHQTAAQQRMQDAAAALRRDGPARAASLGRADQ